MELSTERLQLRALLDKDVKNIQFLRSDSIVNQYVERQETKTLDDALKFIKRIQLSVQKHEICYWSICLKNDPTLIGTICLWNFSKDKKTAEIGYDLHPNFHGKGIMTEALKSVLEFGFEFLNLNHIEAYTQYDNLRSVNLLKKFGFKRNPDKSDKENEKNNVYVLENSD